MEQTPQYETSIERKNVRLSMELGNSAILFDYLNAGVYTFGDPFGDFDHVYRKQDDGDGGIYFFKDEFPELMETLVANNFLHLHSAYPSELDERVWLRREDQKLAKYLERMTEE